MAEAASLNGVSSFLRRYSMRVTLEEDLITELYVLESYVGGTIDRARHNESTMRKFNAFEMTLLQQNSLADMITHVLQDAKNYFDLDTISLYLVDEKGEIGTILDTETLDSKIRAGLVLLENRELLKATFGGSQRPFIGGYKHSVCDTFFKHAQTKPASVAIIPFYRHNKYVGALNLGSQQMDRFSDGIGTIFIERLAAIVSVCLENILNTETIKRTSFIDTLTGVNNRRCFEQRMGEELDRCQRNGEPISCLFLDIDHFKAVNDVYGHQIGDKVLTLVAAAIKTQLRNNDVLARYGGEEFIALLTNINELKVLEIAERIRKTIQSLAIEVDEVTLLVSISIGSATYMPDAKLKSKTTEISTRLIKAADAALYKAKHNGRNRVENGGVIFDQDQGQAETVTSLIGKP